MAAAAQSEESLSDDSDPVPLDPGVLPSSSLSSLTSLESGRISAEALNWLAALSPRKRSCISLRNTEPCVNKALSNLEALKKMIAMREGESTGTPSPVHVGTGTAPRPKSVRVTDRSGSHTGLSVEGVKTGTVLERLSKAKKAHVLNANAIISSVVNLVARLEFNRQNTQVSLVEQETKAQELKDDLGRVDEKRQGMLLDCVQAEHERCALDIRKLRWSANFKGRKLRRLLDDQARLTQRNKHLRHQVNRLNELRPLLDEKVDLEEGKIRNITRMCQETQDDLDCMEQDSEEVEEQQHRIHQLDDTEREKIKEKEAELSTILDTENAELARIKKECGQLTEKVAVMETKNNSLQAKITALEKGIEQSKTEQQETSAKVHRLECRRLELLEEKKLLQSKKKELELSNENELRQLQEAYSASVAAAESEEKHVLKTKRERNDLEQDIETLRETIVLTKLKITDNEKSIARAYREIERLDQQLQVSVVEYNHAFRNHRHVQDEYKLEKLKADGAEDVLKDEIGGLKKKIKEQRKVKILYENKTKAQDATLMKLMVEYEKQENRVLEVVEDVDKQVQDKAEKVEELQGALEKNRTLLAQTEQDLTRTEEEMAAVEIEVGGRKEELSQQEQQLQVEVVQKVQEVEKTTEKIKSLEGKIEDKEKSITMVLKLKNGVVTSLEELKSELNQLEERLNAEIEKEQSWKDEFQEISDFSTDADSRHAKYLKDRHALLKQQTIDLEKSLCLNTELALSYHKLQSEFIKVKTAAMKVIQRKLELETTLRNHQQLLTFQSCFYSALEQHFRGRGVHYMGELQDFHRQSRENSQHISSLRERLETMLTVLLGFLQQQETQKQQNET